MKTVDDAVDLTLDEIREKIKYIKELIEYLPHSGLSHREEFGLYCILGGELEGCYYDLKNLENKNDK